ncbi:MAG TPA: hypothetical protein VLG50_03060 [Candidatus Saccharimonadales bacterium]|nr:hypothetical protein [Candidatus Saccharimonadales bacterium]
MSLTICFQSCTIIANNDLGIFQEPEIHTLSGMTPGPVGNLGPTGPIGYTENTDEPVIVITSRSTYQRLVNENKRFAWKTFTAGATIGMAAGIALTTYLNQKI